MSRQPNPDETLLTATQLRLTYHLPERLLKMLIPAHVYWRIGQKHPIKLYRQEDVEALINSEVGQKLLAEAEERRKRFWESMQKRLDALYQPLPGLKKEPQEKNDSEK